MRYTDFLKDKRFIQWQLFSDSSLDEYWTRYMKENPENVEAIQQAIRFLKTKGAGKELLSEQDNVLLKKNIELSLQRKAKRIRINPFIRIALTACVVAIFVIVGFYLFKSTPSDIFNIDKTETLVVGNMLENQEIQIISGDKTVKFNHDIQVHVDENGKAIIANDKEREEALDMTTSQTNKIIVPYGKRSQLNLHDGSKVWLNSGTVIEFQTTFSKEKREIKLLSGEIYLEVTHNKNKPFFVQTPKFNIQVYGTKFNVSSYANSHQTVVLVEGSIGLKTTNKELKMIPDEQAIFTGNDSFITKKIDAEQFVSWTEGYLVFDKTPIEEVLTQIARYYNLSFDYGTDTNIEKRTCTGKIYLSDNLDDIMQTIALLSSTKYQKDENQIRITNKN